MRSSSSSSGPISGAAASLLAELTRRYAPHSKAAAAGNAQARGQAVAPDAPPAAPQPAVRAAEHPARVNGADERAEQRKAAAALPVPAHYKAQGRNSASSGIGGMASVQRWLERGAGAAAARAAAGGTGTQAKGGPSAASNVRKGAAMGVAWVRP